MGESPHSQSQSKNICRTCLTEKGNFQSIFLSKGNREMELIEDIHLSDMICACANVQITLGDGLPEKICIDCVKQTINMYLFKIKCEDSDAFLRSQIIEQKIHYSVTANNILEDINIPCAANENQNGKLEPTSQHTTKVENSEEVFEDVDFCYVDNSEMAHDESDSENDMTNVLDTQNVLKTKEYECDICLKKFSREDLLLRHKIAHAMKLNQENVEVDGTYIMESAEEEGTIIIKTQDVLYSCQNCNSIFVHKSDLDKHIQKEHNIERTSASLVCDICFKRFKKPAHLKRHKRIHSAVKPYSCDQCNKCFTRADQLQYHVNLHSGAKPHTCKICFKGFRQISNLKDHMRTHNGEKPFLCSTCGKGFNQLGNLRQHTVRHSGVKAHICSICESGFASKGELSAHLRKHTGARPFVCDTCNHGFTTSSSLTKHKRIHSGEKPYECDVCHMKFSRSGILSRHKRTHTGEKPYVCSFCSKAFTQSNDLTSHLRIHTGEKPYTCEQCGQAFRQSSALKTHRKIHANNNMQKTFKTEITDQKPILIHFP